MRDKLVAMLKKEEGFNPVPYKDSFGWSIGYGHFCIKRMLDSVTEPMAEAILLGDIHVAEEGVNHWFPTYLMFEDTRQDALIAMAFQMGADVFAHFPKATGHVRGMAWKEAAEDFMDSLWAREQTPARASRVCKMIETGEYPEEG